MSDYWPREKVAADAYRHAALMVQLGLDGLRANGGQSTPVFLGLVAALERMATYAEHGAIPGDSLPVAETPGSAELTPEPSLGPGSGSADATAALRAPGSGTGEPT
jgi:hypothetical protein